MEKDSKRDCPPVHLIGMVSPIFEMPHYSFKEVKPHSQRGLHGCYFEHSFANSEELEYKGKFSLTIGHTYCDSMINLLLHSRESTPNQFFRY